MKIFRYLFLLIFFSQSLFLQAQFTQADYQRFFEKAKAQYFLTNYLDAFEQFDMIKEHFAQTEQQKDELSDWKEKCRIKIRQEQDARVLALEAANQSQIAARLAYMQLKEAQEQERKANSAFVQSMKEKEAYFNSLTKALKLADKMQKKMEAAIFEKSVREISKRKPVINELGKFNYLEIDSLNFSYNELSRVPDEVVKCKNLVSINLIGTDIVDWTDCFSKLSGLNKLSEVKLSLNSLDSIPTQYWNKITGIEIRGIVSDSTILTICKQPQLTYLDLSRSGLKKLPNEITNLAHLEYLDLSNNELASIPSEISNLLKLKNLNISYNKLDGLPTKFAAMKSLVSLNLEGNILRKLPENFNALTSLIRLNLSKNKLYTLPLEFGDIVNLEYLDLSSNDLAQLPVSFSNFSSLLRLSLAGNNLVKLPDEFGKMQKLNYLDLSNNLFQDFPPALSFLAALNFLDLSQNEITAYPIQVGIFNRLVALYIDDFTFSGLPKSILRYDNIMAIKIRATSATYLNEALFKLKKANNLVSLTLAGTNLSAISKDILSLTKLSILELNDSSMAQIPDVIFKIKNLKTLKLNSCPRLNFKESFDLINSNLVLDNIYLENNNLYQLPQNIINHNSLFGLYLDGNKLQSLRNEIVNLNNLTYLSLKNNIISLEERERIVSLLPKIQIQF